jgi:hypothetical protein
VLENITLGQVAAVIIFVGGLIGGIKYLKKELKEALKEMLNDQFDEVNDKLDAMQASLKKVDTQTCKNFLVRFLADVERGDHVYDDEKRRFWEEYDHYIDELKENSYVKEWANRLIDEGKLRR